MFAVSPLPIDAHLPALVAQLQRDRVCILAAEPGAGKTTRVPRALLLAGEGQAFPGEIWVLEPRRVAAKLSASRVAFELGEALGVRVGYSIRDEEVTSPATRIRFLTEGMFIRKLLGNPTLHGVSVVVLDEFHERHLQSDMALTLTKERLATTPALHLVVMSATLDTGPLARYLAAEVLQVEGRTFPVVVSYDASLEERPLELRVAAGVRSALRATTGSILVFLPGAREIHRARETLAKVGLGDVRAEMLHGDMSLAEQQRVLATDGQRKVILTTNIAESSLTVPGVTAVVDSGLVRKMNADPVSGLQSLQLEPTSRASAIQRMGRAGRTQDGICIRLYSAGNFERRPAFDVPELLRADFSSVLLEMAALGAQHIDLLDPPRAEPRKRAEVLLQRLGALDAIGNITAHGRDLVRFPLPVRLAKFFLDAHAGGETYDGAAIAALLSERDIRLQSTLRAHGNAIATEQSDLHALLDLYREAQASRFARQAVAAMGLDADVLRRVERSEPAAFGPPPRARPPQRTPAQLQSLMWRCCARFPTE
jgi:ATP-dependent helicase HrpB